MAGQMAKAFSSKEKADLPQHDSKLDCRRVPPPCLETQPGGKALVFWLARTTGQKTTQVRSRSPPANATAAVGGRFNSKYDRPSAGQRKATKVDRGQATVLVYNRACLGAKRSNRG